jgi:minor extracellular protease Epr
VKKGHAEWRRWGNPVRFPVWVRNVMGAGAAHRSLAIMLAILLAGACALLPVCPAGAASTLATASASPAPPEATPEHQPLDASGAESPREPAKVALIDTGVRPDRLPEGARVEPGRNYVFDDRDTTDLVGHGTKIASIILSIAPDVTLVPLVYYSQYPSSVPANGGIEAICRAIYDAIDVFGCRIVNVSSGVLVDDPALREAVRYAEEKGVIVISAVGNDRVTAPERVFYPAGYETVIGVGAIDKDLGIARFSQVNSSVTVVAPGADLEVLSIRGGSVTEKVSGTSYAAAHVAAHAALLAAAYPDMTPAEFRHVLRISSRDLGTVGYDETFGWGYVGTSWPAGALAYERMLRVKALPFADVSVFDWFSDAVLEVYEKGLMPGESESVFGPRSPVTFEVLATALYRLHALHTRLDSEDEAPATPDAYLDWAIQSGLLDRGDGPALDASLSQWAAAPVTRDAVCAVLIEYCRYAGIELPLAESEVVAFHDIEQASDWTREYIAIARAAGIIGGDGNGMFRPADVLSRAELATLLVRLVGMLERAI